MKKLILFFVIITGCTNDEINERSTEKYLLFFSMQIPSETSKVPTCKNGNPTQVAYTVINSRNEEYIYFSDLQLENGRYVNSSEISLPIGNYTITSIELINGQDILYSVPDTTDGTILHYADVILPIDISMDRDVTISARAFCYTQSEAPSIEHILEGGYEANRLGSLFFYVQDNQCTKQVTVTIDGYRTPEIIIFEPGTYEVAIPQEYNYILIQSYDENGRLLEGIDFDSNNPYSPSQLLIFNTEDCE